MPTTILDGETYEQARHRRFTEEAKVIEKMQQDEIIRMAREACAPNQTFNSDEEWVKRFAALVAANEREKQAEQEPVAWFVQYKNRHEFVFGNKPEFIIDGVVEPLYAAPVRKKELTDDELASACGWKLGDPMYEWVVDLGRWAIAADREKNK